MNGFRDIFDVTAPFRRKAALRAMAWQFGQVSTQITELYAQQEYERPLDEVGCCLRDGVFYLGLFRQDGSATVAAMPGHMAERLAHFIHFDLLEGQG